MSTIKLHEATKEFKISNKLAMFFLEKIKLPVKSHSSVISLDQLELLREFCQNPKKFKHLQEAFDDKESGKKKPAEELKSVEEKKPEKKITEKSKGEKDKSEAVPQKKPSVKKEAVRKEQAEPAKKAAPKKELPIKEPEKQKKEPVPSEKVPPKPDKIPLKTEVPIKKETLPPLPPPPPRPVAPAPPPSRPQKKEPLAAQPVYITKKPSRPHPMEQRHGYAKSRPMIHPKPLTKAKPEPALVLPESIQIPDLITPRELAEKLGCKLRVIEEKIEALNLNYQGNEIMEIEDVQKICQELNVKTEVVSFEKYIHLSNIARTRDSLVSRPPVVTVMGHVDHGKTTLLDTLRKTRVAEKEAGGITQKIGAYKLDTPEGGIVFIDTPGHEAFTNLRARGAKVTDIVILVVAANDGVQPQTIEAIEHARAANVPMIIAINKIDSPGASAEKVKQDLTRQNVLVEEWGGDVVAVEISAKLNQNLHTLLEMIHLVAQMQELKAYKNISARGTIIESRLDPQLGPLATLLIQHGSLKRGDTFICGNAIGKVKTIFNDRGQTLNTADTSDPVEIMGFEALPNPGDVFQVIDNVEKAQKVIETRKTRQKDARSKDILADKKLSFQNLFQLLEQNKSQIFPFIIKADNTGSSEVLEILLQKQGRDKLKIEIIAKGIGNISESDVLLASASNAVIIGFNVKASQKVLTLAKEESIEIKLYSVIYHLIEDITKAIQGKIAPEYHDVLIGKVEVLQKFKISKVGYVAGCVVREGKVTRKSKVKVLRGSDLVFEGELETLKRIKDEASEVKEGLECGIRIKNFNAFEPGDILEAYETEVVK